MAIDQIAQLGLSSLKVIYYSEQLFSQETGIELKLLIAVMKSVSFDFKEGAGFSASTIEEPSNCALFRNKPFLRLSSTEYLPIEGKFIEEILFDNLFHKVHLYSGKNKEF